MKMINKTKFAIGTSLVAGLVTGCANSDLIMYTLLILLSNGVTTSITLIILTFF
jgi:hypothetical protein